jgi:hypothetical protein
LECVDPRDVAAILPAAKIVVVVGDPADRFLPAFTEACENAGFRWKQSAGVCARLAASTMQATFANTTGLTADAECARRRRRVWLPTEPMAAESLEGGSVGRRLANPGGTDRKEQEQAGLRAWAVSAGRYAEHVQRYLDAGHAPEDILVVVASGSNPGAALRAIEAHAGVAAAGSPGAKAPASATGVPLGETAPPSPENLDRARAYYAPHNAALARLIAERGLKTDVPQSEWPGWLRDAQAQPAAAAAVTDGGGLPRLAAGEPVVAFPWADSPRSASQTAPPGTAQWEWIDEHRSVPSDSSKQAYATLLTGNNPSYLRAAL